MSSAPAPTPAVAASLEAKRKAQDEATAFAKDFIGFMSDAVTQFHAVEEVVKRLLAAGYTQISEKKDSDWKVVPGGRYFFTRNQSSVVAFAVGGQWKPGNGFSIFGAHTDSPVLKVKPKSKTAAHGYHQVAIETYGGGLWNTWFDRDLSVAGRVIVASEDGKGFESKLVRINSPIMRIPNLAIHLNRGVNDGFAPNTQTHLLPILASTVQAELMGADKEIVERPLSSTPDLGTVPEPLTEHHPYVIRLLAEELKVAPSRLREFELCLYDTQPPAIIGGLNEFVVARGLDNLCMSYVSLRALLDSADTLKDDEQVRMVALFDNEEIGSNTMMGADSALLPQVLKRINGDTTSYDTAIAKSILVSADMAHALHPNYADKHEPGHKPMIHKGLVIKQNANQRYATTSVTTFLLSEIARRHDLPLQKFVVRNDTGCGSTIGPILASQLGVRTIDVGIPQWAMHSIRETCGTTDLATTYALFKAFFSEFAALDKSVRVDA